MRSRNRGVTLIELMIVVLVIAILASVAYPSYRTQVVKTHRSAAKACLAQYAQFMERYYTTNLTYLGANPTLGCATEGGLDARYGFSVTAATASAYTVAATPTVSWASRDTLCGTLTLNERGVRTESGTASSIDECW